MMIFRPVATGDLNDILALAAKTGTGLTSLPHDEQILAERIDRSLRTWQGSAEPGDQGYLFVLEDSDRGKVVGVSGIEVAVGLNDPWYNFRVGTLVHASRSLNVYNRVPTLYLSNDHTGQSELCTLFLDPDYRVAGNGQLLIKARLLFMAAFRDRFSQRVVAEMRGVSDEQGNSPFWENVGQRFFSIDFAKADYLSGAGNKAFIAELMPKHPLYVDFLSEQARAVIGQVHPHTAPAKRALESEGMRYQNYIDIFDGGPTLEAEIDTLRIVRENRLYQCLPGAQVSDDGSDYLLANNDYQQFRVVLARALPRDRQLEIASPLAAALRLAAGDALRAVPLFAKEIPA